jgi:hypothetical protein
MNSSWAGQDWRNCALAYSAMGRHFGDRARPQMQVEQPDTVSARRSALTSKVGGHPAGYGVESSWKRFGPGRQMALKPPTEMAQPRRVGKADREDVLRRVDPVEIATGRSESRCRHTSNVGTNCSVGKREFVEAKRPSDCSPGRLPAEAGHVAHLPDARRRSRSLGQHGPQATS